MFGSKTECCQNGGVIVSSSIFQRQRTVQRTSSSVIMVTVSCQNGDVTGTTTVETVLMNIVVRIWRILHECLCIIEFIKRVE